MKPRLPSVIEQSLPDDILHHIYSFVPYPKKVKPQHSPILQKELTRIQSIELKGKCGTFMKGLDDFCLD